VNLLSVYAMGSAASRVAFSSFEEKAAFTFFLTCAN